MILLASLLACTGAAPSPATPAATPAPAEAPTASPDDQIRALLGPEEQLNRPAIVGAVGDQPSCVSAVIASGARPDLELIVRCGDAVVRSGQLQSWASYEEGPVWLQDADGDGKSEVIVMSSWMTGMGPTGAEPFQANSVMRLSGGALSHLEAVEVKVGPLETEQAVRAALSAR